MAKLKKEVPTFNEQIEVIEGWWQNIIKTYIREKNRSIKSNNFTRLTFKNTLEVPLEKVFDFILRKNIVSDR